MDRSRRSVNPKNFRNSNHKLSSENLLSQLDNNKSIKPSSTRTRFPYCLVKFFRDPFSFHFPTGSRNPAMEYLRGILRATTPTAITPLRQSTSAILPSAQPLQPPTKMAPSFYAQFEATRTFVEAFRAAFFPREPYNLNANVERRPPATRQTQEPALPSPS